MDWLLCDDGRDYDHRSIDSGTEEQVKARYFIAIDTGLILEIDAYIEDPGGDQYTWDREAGKWVKL
jgi:hypothetical protein